MLTIKANTKAFKAFKNEARTESRYSYCNIKPSGRYFTLQNGKAQAKDGRYYYDILPHNLFYFYAPDNCSKISMCNALIDKQYANKFNMRFILRINENSASLRGPESFYYVHAKVCANTKMLTNVTVSKYNIVEQKWENFATRKGQIHASDLALFLLHNNYASAQKRFKASVDSYASYVAETGDYS